MTARNTIILSADGVELAPGRVAWMTWGQADKRTRALRVVRGVIESVTRGGRVVLIDEFTCARRSGSAAGVYVLSRPLLARLPSSPAIRLSFSPEQQCPRCEGQIPREGFAIEECATDSAFSVLHCPHCDRIWKSWWSYKSGAWTDYTACLNPADNPEAYAVAKADLAALRNREVPKSAFARAIA